jgi:hypothetical protein
VYTHKFGRQKETSMVELDTTRSDAITKKFLARNVPFQRKVLVFGREFTAPPQIIFKQFCPSREADWINGWTVDLVYSETGYAEPLCVFRTPASNLLGAGFWIMTKVEPERTVEAVMFHEDHDFVEHMKLDIVDLGNGKTNVTWTITMTALSEKGNTMVEMVPDETPAFVEELEYFLTHGELKPLPA